MTAVEWLIEQICGEHTGQWIKEIELAKEMEKEQIVNAFNLGQQKEAKQEFWTKGEQYYNETFSNKGD